MRAAEERYPGYPDTIPELMERAGGAVAREAMLAYPAATRFACVCGGGSNGGDGRVAARVLREAGHVADEVDDGLGRLRRRDRRALRNRLPRCAAPRGGVDHRADQRVAGRSRLGRRAFGRRCVDGRDRGRRGGRRSHGDLPRRRRSVSSWRRVGSRPGGSSSPGSGWSLRPTEIVRATPAILDAVPRRGDARHEVQLRGGRRRGGQPGMTGAACLSAMAALRADAGYVTLAVPEEALATAEAIALEPVKVGWSEDDAVETIAAAAERATALALGPGLGRGAGRRELVRGAARSGRLAGRGRRGRSLRFRAGVAARGHGPHAARRRARPTPRPRLRVGRRTSARGRPNRGGHVRRDRAPEGARHARRVARRLRHGVRPRAPPRSRRQGPGTSSRASPPHSSQRGSTPRRPLRPRRLHTGAPRSSSHIRQEWSRAICSEPCPRPSRPDGTRDDRREWPGGAVVLHPRPRCDPQERRDPAARRRRRRAVGGRQGGGVRPRRRRRLEGCARRGCDGALRRDLVRGAPSARGAAQRSHRRHGARLGARDRRGARRPPRARRRRTAGSRKA